VDRCGKEQRNEKIRKGADRGGKKQTVTERSRQMRKGAGICEKEQTEAGRSSLRKEQAKADRNRPGIVE
jgi:hypothetical protein